MRWFALSAALFAGAALLLLLVMPPATALPATAMRASVDQASPRTDIQPVSTNGHKARWRRHCP